MKVVAVSSPRSQAPLRRPGATSTTSWCAFGAGWGAIVGLAGDGGVLSAASSGLLVGVACAIFGLRRRGAVRIVAGKSDLGQTGIKRIGAS